MTIFLMLKTFLMTIQSKKVCFIQIRLILLEIQNGDAVIYNGVLKNTP